LAKIGALIGLGAGLALFPLADHVHVERPSVLYAIVYFQAMLGHTDSAVKIAQQAARSEAAAGQGSSAARECPRPCTF
jgi:hypothetical protein